MANYRKSFNFRNGVQVDNDNFVVNQLGLVGIGTTIPTEFLVVRGNVTISGLTTTDNFHAGMSTISTLNVSDSVTVSQDIDVAGVVTATSFDGLGQIGVGSEGTFIGVGITMVDFKSSNASNTVDVEGTSGIATVTVTTGVSIGLAIALGG